jgi:hypothetical protein
MDQQSDPFAVRMVFLRVGWMNRYQGIIGGDTITSGGAYVTEHGYGHEIFNFKPFQQAVYGYVQPPGRTDRWQSSRINLARFGASSHDESVSGVLAVWVATTPTGGAFVVGWYRNATLYRDWQPPPADSNRRYADADLGYYVTASSEDAVLLPPDERVFSIPQKGTGSFGQANIWYADDRVVHGPLRRAILDYVETRRLPSAQKSSGPAPRQPDLLLRQKVEQIAVRQTAAYFRSLGYHVETVERDNVGWDLNARLVHRHLRLEVKGLSGSPVLVELTPNEYAAMRQYRESYRLCVVINALTEPQLEIFSYSPDSDQWESPQRRTLTIQEMVAARCIAT